MVLLGKIMILQGVGHQISCLGVCYANDPKKGGYMTPAPALDLTTSLRGDFRAPSAPPYLWPVAVDPWQLSGPGGQGRGGGGSRVPEPRRRPPRGPARTTDCASAVGSAVKHSLTAEAAHWRRWQSWHRMSCPQGHGDRLRQTLTTRPPHPSGFLCPEGCRSADKR